MPGRTYLKIVLSVMFGAAAGFWAGQISANFRFATSAEDRQSEADHLRHIHNRFLEIIRQGDGWLPHDPYEALASHSSTSSFTDLLVSAGTVPVFDVLRHPARISSEVTNNAPLALFSFLHRDLSVTFGLADGRLITFGNSRTGMQAGNQAHHETDRLMDKAGYPGWQSKADRTDWMNANHDRLKWNPSLRMFVVE